MEVYHVIAYMVGKKSSDPDLDIEQYENAREFLEDKDEGLLAYLTGYEIQDNDLFPKSFFKPSIRDKIFLNWILAILRVKCTPSRSKKICKYMLDIFTCPASSAGLERTFSSYGLIHTKLRNRLSNERCRKLVKVYRNLRDKNAVEEDNFEIVSSSENEEGVYVIED